MPVLREGTGHDESIGFGDQHPAKRGDPIRIGSRGGQQVRVSSTFVLEGVVRPEVRIDRTDGSHLDPEHVTGPEVRSNLGEQQVIVEIVVAASGFGLQPVSAVPGMGIVGRRLVEGAPRDADREGRRTRIAGSDGQLEAAFVDALPHRRRGPVGSRREGVGEAVRTDRLHREFDGPIGRVDPVLRDHDVESVRHDESSGEPGPPDEPGVLDRSIRHPAPHEVAMAEAGQPGRGPDLARESAVAFGGVLVRRRVGRRPGVVVPEGDQALVELGEQHVAGVRWIDRGGEERVVPPIEGARDGAAGVAPASVRQKPLAGAGLDVVRADRGAEVEQRPVGMPGSRIGGMKLVGAWHLGSFPRSVDHASVGVELEPIVGAIQVAVVVGHQERSDPGVPQRVERRGADSVVKGPVEAGERLVEKGDGGTPGQQSGEAYPRPFAAGELRGERRRELGRVGRVEGLFDPLFAFGSREAEPGDRHPHVLPRVEMVVEREVLLQQPDGASARGDAVDVPALHDDRTGLRRVEPGEASQERALPAARGAHEGDESGRGKDEIHRPHAAAVRMSADHAGHHEGGRRIVIDVS